jgi:DNA polymerase elongation subunit (family B)
MKFGYLDIETTSFKANFGHMMSWAMYIPDRPQDYLVDQKGPIAYNLENGFGVDDPNFGGKVLHDQYRRSEAIDWRRFDKRICKSLLKALDQVDMVVTYWGTGFDVPFIRTRCLAWELGFPKYMEKLHLDLYYSVRPLLKLGRNTLDQATAFFGIEGKNHVDYEIWNRARVGDKEAMGYVIDHNIEDVKILAVLHSKIGGYRQITRRSL